MSSGNTSLFNINATTGVVYLRSPVDFESSQSHSLTASATDNFPGAPAFSSVAVTINVTDLTDEAPVFTQPTFEATLFDGDYINQFVMTLAVFDADAGDILTFSSLPPIVSLFSIGERSGNVVITGRLCFAEQSNYTQQVAVTDRAGLRNVANVTLSVRRINAHAPAFQAVQYANQLVVEGNAIGLAIATVVATDADCADTPNLAYSTVGGDTSFFTLNSSSGAITAAQEFDREQTAQLRLVVQVTDNGNPPRTNTIEVVVTVQDRNDMSPVFARTFFNLTVDEGEAAGRAMASLVATDGDATSPNNNFTYAIHSGNVGNTFVLNRFTGALTLGRTVCASDGATFNLTISVTDGGVPALGDTANVLVSVVRNNRFDPEFDSALIRRILPENAPVGSVLVELGATDSDCSPTNLIFSIDPSGPDAFFVLDSANRCD